MTDDQDDGPSLTIVGGQPRKVRGQGSSRMLDVPAGIETLLYRAARDTELRKRLLADPLEASGEAGIELRASETALLRSISSAALATMIDAIVPENPRGRSFMGRVAVAATSLAASTAAATVVVACDDEDLSGPEHWSGGAGPDTTVDGGAGGETGSGGDAGAGGSSTGGAGGSSTGGAGGSGGSAGGAGGSGGDAGAGGA